MLGINLCLLYNYLARQAASVNTKLWKLSPKLHMFLNLTMVVSAVGGTYINPRFYWTYGDEDLIGQLIEVAESCHALTVSVSALFKWMHLAFPE